MAKELFYATNNPGKVIEISKLLKSNNITVITPKDLNIELDVPETGNTLEENANLKVQAFTPLVEDRIVLADDTGLEIDALNGEPGIHVRRWRDRQIKMDDQEIIDFCLQRMKGVLPHDRGAQFRTVLAIGIPGKDIETYDGSLRGIILEEPSNLKMEGFPFESLFFIPEFNMLMGELHMLSMEQKNNMHNHRERALSKAIPRIKELLK